MKKKLILLLLLFAQISFAQTATRSKKPAKPVVLTKDQVSEIKSAAGSYYKEQNYKMALNLYRQLQATEPENMEYNYRLGICYLNTCVNKGMAANFSAGRAVRAAALAERLAATADWSATELDLAELRSAFQEISGALRLVVTPG